MRPILAVAILLLCLSRAAPEPEYSSLLPGSFHLGGGTSFASLVEIESSQARGDREAVAAPPSDIGEQTPAAAAPQTSAAPPTNSDPTSEQVSNPGAANTAPPVPLDELCSALLTSAQDNDLPVAFFANLIWQESRLRDDAVSPKGALGIAQFMPRVAVASGLENPFDPLQALSASARLLRELRDRFGNLGFVAAAYNAGARRVGEWLKRRRALPRETRGYVIDVTGRSVEQWQKTPPDDADLRFVRRLPCRDYPAFAELEQAQLQQAQLERAQARQAQAEEPQPQKPKPPEKARAKPHSKRQRMAERKHLHAPLHREKAHTAERERRRGKHEAKQRIRRAPHGRHRRA